MRAGTHRKPANPPDYSWHRVKRRNATGSSRIPSRLAHRTRPVRQYRASATLSRLLPPRPSDPRTRLPPASPHRYDGEEMAVSHPHPGAPAPRGAQHGTIGNHVESSGQMVSCGENSSTGDSTPSLSLSYMDGM